MENKKNTIGLLGFIFSIVSIATLGLTSIVGLILSIFGLSESKKCNNDKKDLSIAGIIISSMMLCILVVLVVVSLHTNTNNQQNSVISNQNEKVKQQENSSNTNSSSSTIEQSKNKKYGLGDTIVFDGLQITFDQNYSFNTIDNRYSEYNGRSVIKIGVNVKNVSNEKNHLNMFFYDLFGSQGTELDSVTSYFDDVIDYAGDLKPDASYRTNFYILYDGDGKYSIDFDNFSQELSVEFNITK